MPVYSLLKDAGKLTGCVCVMDVFRSSNTIIEILSQGAERVVPVETLEEGISLRDNNPDWLLFGERKGTRLAGCDGDNSPVNRGVTVSGKTVIITTSGGTRCILGCGDECDVFIGSFANASSLVRRFVSLGCDAPAFWAVGQQAKFIAEEDELCAEYMESLWSQDNNILGAEAIRNKLLKTKGANRLRELGQMDDLEYCVSVDSRSVLPRRIPMGSSYWCIVNDCESYNAYTDSQVP